MVKGKKDLGLAQSNEKFVQDYIFTPKWEGMSFSENLQACEVVPLTSANRPGCHPFDQLEAKSS